MPCLTRSPVQPTRTIASAMIARIRILLISLCSLVERNTEALFFPPPNVAVPTYTLAHDTQRNVVRKGDKAACHFQPRARRR
jgi:hypothetical protein